MRTNATPADRSTSIITTRRLGSSHSRARSAGSPSASTPLHSVVDAAAHSPHSWQRCPLTLTTPHRHRTSRAPFAQLWPWREDRSPASDSRAGRRRRVSPASASSRIADRHRHLAELHRRIGVDHLLPDLAGRPPLRDLRAAGALAVDEEQRPVLQHQQLGVLAADRGIGDHHVAFRRAAD